MPLRPQSVMTLLHSLLLSVALSAAELEVAHPLEVNAAYFGEMGLHPGLRAGVDVGLVVSPRHALIGGLRTGFYVAPGQHSALAAGARLAWRFTALAGFSAELFAGASLLGTFSTGDVYGERSDGTVGKVANAPYAAFMPEGGLTLGWNLSRTTLALPLRPFFNLGMFGRFPVNTHWVPHPFVEIGLAFIPGGRS